MSAAGVKSEGEFGPPTWVRAISRVIARVNTSGTSNTTGTPIVWVRNPSRRLSCFVSVSFEPDVTATIGSYTSSTYGMTAYRRNRTNARLAELHTLLTSGTSLPHAMEFDSAVRVIRVATSLAIPTVGGSSVAGNWVCSCEWEPNQPMDDDTVRALLNLCDVELAGEPPTLAP